MRAPSHRGKYLGRDERQRHYHLNKLFCQLAASRDLAAAMRPAGVGIYRISPGLVLRFRTTLGEALPYLDDDEGRVRL